MEYSLIMFSIKTAIANKPPRTEKFEKAVCSSTKSFLIFSAASISLLLLIRVLNAAGMHLLLHTDTSIVSSSCNVAILICKQNSWKAFTSLLPKITTNVVAQRIAPQRQRFRHTWMRQMPMSWEMEYLRVTFDEVLKHLWVRLKIMTRTYALHALFSGCFLKFREILNLGTCRLFFIKIRWEHWSSSESWFLVQTGVIHIKSESFAHKWSIESQPTHNLGQVLTLENSFPKIFQESKIYVKMAR